MRRKALPRWTIAGILLIAGACAPVTQASGDGSSGSSGKSADRVLTFAFESIRDRYLTDVRVDQLALEGMRGLSAIDPALTIQQGETGRIFVKYQDRQAAEYAPPAGDDSRAWAGLIMALAKDAQTLSPPMAKAGDEKIYEAVLDAVLAKLDIFSRYAGRAEAADHRAARNGFGGIGVRYDVHPEDIVLTEVLPDTPAATAQLKVGDHVTAVDGLPLAGLDQNEISHRLRGPVSSLVALTLRRGGDQPPSSLTLRRGHIVPQTVTMDIKDGIATIAIASFNQDTAANVTRGVVAAKASPGFKGVVLDLRGNPGGLLDQGVAVADLFMDHGRIVSTRGRHPASMQIYDAKPGDAGEDVALAVLVDGKSASAAEIVASALQDAGRAVVVGTNSFGKGTVQTVIRMPNDGEMTLTWSRFFSPSGYALHGLGVLPTVCTADEHADVKALLASLSVEQSVVPAEIAGWRAVAVDAGESRGKMRATCPAAKHAGAGAAVDAAVARQILEDRGLLAQALALTTPVATASSDHLPGSLQAR